MRTIEEMRQAQEMIRHQLNLTKNPYHKVKLTVWLELIELDIREAERKAS